MIDKEKYKQAMGKFALAADAGRLAMDEFVMLQTSAPERLLSNLFHAEILCARAAEKYQDAKRAIMVLIRESTE